MISFKAKRYKNKVNVMKVTKVLQFTDYLPRTSDMKFKFIPKYFVFLYIKYIYVRIVSKNWPNSVARRRKHELQMSTYIMFNSKIASSK